MNLIPIVRSALRAQLLTVASLPLGRKWQFRRYQSVLGTPWMRETMLNPPGPPQRMNPGPFARLRNTGRYQVDLFFPPDDPSGAKPAEDAAEDIRAAFPDTLELLRDGQKIRCHGAGIGTAVEEPNWVHVPVIIDWSADTYNSN